MEVTIMEARNFITAREMLTDGNWLLTTMNGEPRYQKPPLPTWLSAISASIFGMHSVFAMRLPAVLFAIIIAVYVFKLAKKLDGNKTFGVLAAAIVTSSFYVLGIMIEAPWDIFTHAFMLVAIYYLFVFFQSEKRNWQAAIIAGICIGFSILSKGPVSFYALLLPFLLAYALIYSFKGFTPKIVPFLTLLLIGFTIGGWWYLYVRLEDPNTFLAIAEKETSNWSSYNVRPFYYYWSFFTQSGLWTMPAFISLLYPYLKTRVTNLKAYQFSLLWTLLAVVLLSLIPEKKSRYLMPVLIPLAINCSFYIAFLIREFKHLKHKGETIPVYVNFGLIGLIGLVFPALAYLFLKENLQGYWAYYVVASVVVFTMGLIILHALTQRNIGRAVQASVGLYAALLLTALPLKPALNSDSFHPITTNFNGLLPLYQLQYMAPEMIWEYGNKIPELISENETFKPPAEERFGLLVSEEQLAQVQQLKTSYTIKKQDSFNLNTVLKTSRQYKTRLVAHYFVLTKKD
ncbi:ArnT family glycosyltransferase [Bizionia sediminis]|uniref:ArnT family glycosyltransferase n=1 Tax=Bizionia sediminis TaxID=1737064 RepID=A0ABW5KPI5_9FLAO